MSLDNNAIIPNHIAIIMDGNGRWAKKRGLPRKAGHRQGAKTFTEIVKYCRKIGVKYVTVYAFSTENWKRPKDEVDALMDLLKSYLKDLRTEIKDEGRIRFIGDPAPLDDELKALIVEAEEKTKENTNSTVNIALNYGGRDELVHAVKNICREAENGIIKSEDINEKTISNYIYTYDMPDPDLLIRPGGEKRISNFLLWQCAYSELVFTDVLWPDFTSKDMDDAIMSYSARNRRYGGI